MNNNIFESPKTKTNFLEDFEYFEPNPNLETKETLTIDDKIIKVKSIEITKNEAGELEYNLSAENLWFQLSYLDFFTGDKDWKSILDIMISNKDEMETFNLAGHWLNNFPTDFDEISDWKKLKNIDIQNNRLTDIPTFIEKIPNLNRLYIYQNEINSIPTRLCEKKL